jgi:hypothetical protein
MKKLLKLSSLTTPLILVSWFLCGLNTLIKAETPSQTPQPTSEGLEFFKQKIQPVFEAKCYKCHSAQSEKLKGGLRLDSRDGLLRGGDTGAAMVPGHPEQSLLIKAIRYIKDDLQMPPKEKLSAQQIADFEAWVKLGAPDDRAGTIVPSTAAKARELSAEDRKHWALQQIQRPDSPKVAKASWVRNPIDAFILAELETKKLEPAAPADKITLLRRASLDLIGLPPTPEEVNAFLNDPSSDPFAKAVDRLLASPSYGERWARHWLDLARYAESEGFKADETRPYAWRYRDYVIKSFNDDKPYDRFIKEQIAGDEFWPDDPDARVATAFNRHYADESNARNLMQRRQEILNDITDTVGAVFTGMTYACARCHDHKYDPILQADYYRLQAFFANTAADDSLVLTPADQVKRHHEQLAEWEEKTSAIRQEMAAIEEPKRKAIIKDYVDKYPDEIQVALLKPESERSPFECQMVAKAKLYIDPASHQYIGKTDAIVTSLKGQAKKRWEELDAELKKFDSLRPDKLSLATGMVDLGTEAPKTFLLNRGIYDAPKEAVEPGFLTVLNSKPATITPVRGVATTGRRAALANILTDRENPLTARVMVNRIWQYHFGNGIVGTASDFGVKGDRPTHPAMLDWLANEFVRSGWSIKEMHRLIMTSSTYQQSSQYREVAAKVDPENKLLWRFPRQRLEGETIRDAALTVAGLLNPKMGGPSIFPELPPGMAVVGGWAVTKDEAERNRRSIYVFVRRNTRYPIFETFDMPDTHESCSRRMVTTSPIQALTMLNNKLTLEWAASFAGRVLDFAGTNFDQQIDTAYRLALSRAPDVAEKQIARNFFDRHRLILAERVAFGESLALPPALSEQFDRIQAASLVDFCHMLINANEFVYRN